MQEEEEEKVKSHLEVGSIQERKRVEDTMIVTIRILRTIAITLKGRKRIVKRGRNMTRVQMIVIALRRTERNRSISIKAQGRN